jgi:hypothetical protein
MARQRIRKPLFLISLLLIMLGPFAVSSLNHRIDTLLQANKPQQMQPPASALPLADCSPVINQPVESLLDNLAVASNDDLAVSLRMGELFAGDQAVRRLQIGVDPQRLNEEDTKRRIEVLDLIANGDLHATANLIFAAYIFQHGNCPEHYHLANRLAQIAMEAGDPNAPWIYAASLDRYRMSLGELQKYGTQYTRVDGEFRLYPVDPATTDAERAKFHVPPLQEALDREASGMEGGVVKRQWLETWWLTLIGAGFAALSATITAVDVKENTLHGRVALILALALYLASVLGHYIQVNVLMQGAAETQGNIWSAINGLMIAIWLAFAAFEIARVIKE